MSALSLLDSALPDETHPLPRRSIRRLFLPLFRAVAESSFAWRAESAGFWNLDGERYWMPRLVFQRPGEIPDFKLGIFAGIHGDEPAGVVALCDLVRALEAAPVRARGYAIHVYPLVNPTGYEDGTRQSRSGKDLNREFWRGSLEPEIELLEREILREKYHGFIALHSNRSSENFRAFARGSTLTDYLLRPALTAASEALPSSRGGSIRGFCAEEGITHTASDGILAPPPGARPAPFELILESPSIAPLHLQRAAFVLAVAEILTHYRRLISFGGDL
jgi:murein peptide amidase A